MIPLTNEGNQLYCKHIICHICKKEFSTDDQKYHKLGDNCHYTGKYRGVAPYICNLRYKTPTKIPAAFHSGSKYYYNFIMKELAKEFEGKFECLEEKT